MGDTWIFLIVIAGLGGAVVLIYNSIISKMNAVERAWANVITQERQKNKTIPHVEKIAEEYKLHEAGTLELVTQLRASLGKLSSDKIDIDQLRDIETKTTSLLQGLTVAVEAYPDLKASETYGSLMKEISEQQDHIAAAIRIFNQNVEDFNNGIEIFPNSLVNSLLTKKEKLKTFRDQEAESGFDYTPNIS